MTANETSGLPVASNYDLGEDLDRRVFFDIETAPLREVRQFVDLKMEPPRNYKKKEAISAWQRTAVEKHLEKSALDPDLCRVVAIGWRPEGGALESCVAKTASEEKDAIEQFWAVVGRGGVIGYNCIGFDLPVLLRRSMYLGIRKSVPHFYLSKYRPSANVMDVMVRLSMDGLLPYRSLNWYARRCGLTQGVPTISGRDIPMMVESGQWDLVQQHVEEDVELLRQLALHCHFAD